MNPLEFTRDKINKIDISSTTIRIFDLLFSSINLLLVLPIFMIIALVIKITSYGPVFSKVQRLGRDKMLFNLITFRCSIISNTGQKQGISINNKHHLTTLGQFLRRTRLNKLPMLINVFLGDMSIVGPPPFSPNDLQFLKSIEQRIFKVRPGIINPSSSLYWEEKLIFNRNNRESFYRKQILSQQSALEFNYIKSRTVWSDITFILKSFNRVTANTICKFSITKLRNRHIFMCDIIFILIIPSIAVTIRLDSLQWLSELYLAILFFSALALIVKLPIFYYSGLYNRYWRYSSVGDVALIFISTFLANLILTLILFPSHQILTLYHLELPRSIVFIDFLLTFFFLGGIRFGLRGVLHWYKHLKVTNIGNPVLIVGAGEAGAMIVRELLNNPKLNFKPVVFADDDATKLNKNIQGLPVAGTIKDIPEIVEKYKIKHILVAMPSIPLGIRRIIIDKCKGTGVATDSLPGIYEILAGYKTISRFPNIDIHLLLHRKAIVINHSDVSDLIEDATVLVTGAGGSIGSELCRQIAHFQPKQLVLLGHGENSIFEIGLDLRLTNPDIQYYQIIADVRNYRQMMSVFEEYLPDIVFHAAAHKHVPMMEDNVEEAISNNILGTQNVLLASKRFKVERFILISTDKAIQPKSIMGATKHIAELLTRSIAKSTGRAYLVVRFGNVLGSRGSVIPVFQRQIAAGGPVTITHKEMKRYFMTIPEACQLVLQASVLGNNGELFILDMGDPVRIQDVAVSLIKLSGLKPERDIQIVYTGIRPGEKLNEELFQSCESYQTTKHKEIFVVKNHFDIDEKSLAKDITELRNLVEQMECELAKAHMETIIRKYQGQYLLPATSKNQILRKIMVNG
ncbi:MAG: polysaccharide biosynthesis protein [Promethearchaeota archaeon]